MADWLKCCRQPEQWIHHSRATSEGRREGRHFPFGFKKRGRFMPRRHRGASAKAACDASSLRRGRHEISRRPAESCVVYLGAMIGPSLISLPGFLRFSSVLPLRATRFGDLGCGRACGRLHNDIVPIHFFARFYPQHLALHSPAWFSQCLLADAGNVDNKTYSARFSRHVVISSSTTPLSFPVQPHSSPPSCGQVQQASLAKSSVSPSHSPP